MERRFGADLGNVRLHTGASAQVMSRLLRAQAFTSGRDIFFAAGKLDPDSARGRLLLAHELTHVVQQGAVEQNPPAEEAETGSETPADFEKAESEVTNEEGSPPTQAVAGAPPTPDTGELVKEAPVKKEAAAGREKRQPEAGKEKSAARGAGEKPKGEQPDRGAAEPVVTEAGPKSAPGGGKKGLIAAALRRASQSAFAAKQALLARLAGNEKRKQPARSKLEQAQKAVVPPVGEGASRARAGQVKTVSKAQAPEPREDKARDKLDKALDKAVPKNLKQVDSFKKKGKGKSVGKAVKQVVTKDVDEVRSTYQKIGKPAKAPPPARADELPEIEQPPETATIDPGEGVVGEVPPEHTDFSDLGQESDTLLEQQEISEEQLEMVDEGELAEAKQERHTIKSTVSEGPRRIKLLEQQQKQGVQQELRKDEQEGRQQMRQARRQRLQGALADQHRTRTRITQTRKSVTTRINKIYERARTKVKRKLDDLEKRSLKAFERGQAAAAKRFEKNVKRRIKKFKRRRYSGWTGGLKWAKDKLLGMDDLPEVKKIFDSEKSSFVSSLDKLIRKITAASKRVIDECRGIVSKARQGIQTFIDGLDPELKATCSDAISDIDGKLNALDEQITARQAELQEKLASKREAAIEEIDKKIEEMKEEMSGALAKLGSLLLDAALKLFKWALKKAGLAADQLMSILDKGKAVITKIVTDPIGFIKNIVKAVGDGIGLFRKNIKKHLVGGLISWLTGAMSDIPIQIPAKLDLKGIIDLVLQILGLTWESIRTRLVKRLGERAVKAAETSIDIVKRLVTEGPMALWEMLKDKAVEIKQQVMDGIREWVITQVVRQGIIKLLSFLNPAGAIIQAIIAIYKTIMFFVENWKRILRFVQTVFDSIGDIAMGKLAKAAQAVEQALAMTIPIILSFLARLLGISGIGKAVSGIIKKIRKPIDKVVDKVLDTVVGMARSLLNRARSGAGALKDKVVQWWKIKKGFRTRTGARHTLYFKQQGRTTELLISSKPRTYSSFIASLKPVGPEQEAARSSAVAVAGRIDSLIRSRSRRDTVNQTEVVRLLDELAAHTAVLAEEETEIPASIITYGSLTGEGGATLADATILSSNHPAGSAPKDMPPIWRKVNRRMKRNVFDRGHLLNHNLGGLGIAGNLTPITGKGAGPGNANTQHLFKVERFVKQSVAAGEVVRYRIKAEYGGHSTRSFQQTLVSRIGTEQEKAGDRSKLELMEYEQKHLASHLETRWVPLQHDGKQWSDKKGEKEREYTIENKLPDGDFELR
jgi:hypothetical protein